MDALVAPVRLKRKHSLSDAKRLVREHRLGIPHCYVCWKPLRKGEKIKEEDFGWWYPSGMPRVGEIRKIRHSRHRKCKPEE